MVEPAGVEIGVGERPNTCYVSRATIFKFGSGGGGVTMIKASSGRVAASGQHASQLERLSRAGVSPDCTLQYLSEYLSR